MSTKKFFIISLSLIVLAGCISPYYPTVTKYDNVLVVDGQLTNLAGPYKVKLSRSFKFDEKFGTPVINATVKIINDAGIEVELKESSNVGGEYSTTDSTFRGVVGKSYKLQIKIKDLMYESSFEMLKKPVPLDKLYWEYKPQTAFNARGVQLFVDTHDPENTSRYYMWDFEETWRFRVPLEITNHPEWLECYATNPNKTFTINTSIKTHTDFIDRQSLSFINEASNRLYLRYTLLAKQYILSEQAYKYFDGLVNLNQNQGSLFDPIPYSLVGNIKCTTNKDIPVVGYFMVTGVSEKRIFIDRSELPNEFHPISGFENCSSLSLQVSAGLNDFREDRSVDSLMNNGYQIYEQFNIWTPVHGKTVELHFSKPYCYNCLASGDNKVPSFWVEKYPYSPMKREKDLQTFPTFK